MTILMLVAYFVAGFCQWSVATFRTWFIAKDRPKLVAVVVFIEEILLVGVTAYVVNNPKKWWLLFSGALGGAIGSYVCMKLKDHKRKPKPIPQWGSFPKVKR
jgi:uncharacterized protein YebE (UPF0316 family)